MCYDSRAMDETNLNPDCQAYVEHSIDNEIEIIRSKRCGCFFCRHIYDARSITDWYEEEGHISAVCPECGMDAVVGDASGLPIDKATLKSVNEIVFGNESEVGDDAAIKYCARYATGKITHKEKNEELYRQYLHQLFRAGNEYAALELGRLAETGGDFGTIDRELAISYYTDKILKTNGEAFARLAGLYLTSEDEKHKAFDAAAKALAFDDPMGKVVMADAIASGSGTQQSVDQSFAIVNDGFEDYFDALTKEDIRELHAFIHFAYRLGKAYRYALGTEMDREGALRYFLYARLGFLACDDLDYEKPYMQKDVDQEINALAEELGLNPEPIVFDANMFYDSFSVIQDEEAPKEFHLIKYDENTRTLEFEIRFLAPTPLIDVGNVACKMQQGETRFTFTHVAYFKGENGVFNRVGSSDGESWNFYSGDKQLVAIRFENEETSK